MRKTLLLLSLLSLSSAYPQVAEGVAHEPGARVLVKGRFQRKCAARVNSVPSPGFARLEFDQPGCGDAAQPYAFSQLQSLSFVPELKHGKVQLVTGDAVVVKGFHARHCAGRVKEISKSGLVAVSYDTLLCADTEGLLRAAELIKVSFVKEWVDAGGTRFELGQRVSAPGIIDGESCQGSISTLADNGMAAISFDQLTCAYAGKLFSLDELKTIAPAKKRHSVSGEQIFQRIMREIASSKKSKHKSVKAPSNSKTRKL